jgi:xanthine dehydrogenase accessory factor
MRELYDILDALKFDGRRSVLATIVQVEGSAYRKPGAAMLFLEDGSQVGLLTAGCLEADLAVRISEWMEKKEQFEKAESRTIRYDMSGEDDLSWEQGAGCNGIVHVLLEPVTSRLRSDLLRLRELLKAGIGVSFIRELSPEGVVRNYSFIPEKGDMFGGQGNRAHMQLSEKFIPCGNASDCYLVYDESDSSLFIQRLAPRPKLTLIGAGPDARPLARLAAEVGFSVTVADWRDSFCNQSFFPAADERIVAPPRKLLEKLELTPQDYVVVMTHHFQNDKEFVRKLTKQKLRYLGVLGTERRISRLLGEEEAPAFLHSPVGLGIGAEGPEEIAVSVVAEMISIHRQTP